MKMNWIAVKLMLASSLLAMAGCGDLVVKVEKKPKNVNTSSLQSADSLNLADSDDFLKQLDSLKVVAVDLVVKELSQHDYRTELRNQIRSYRSYLIDHATKPVDIDDSFYTDDSQDCRKTGLSLNMNNADNALGMILKTAVLAKISEVSAAKLNPGLSKEVAAIGQLILMELGVKIDGKVAVDNSGDITTTTGTFTLKLDAIAGEPIDDATKKRDAAEVLSISFSRALGKDYVGTFTSTIEVGHLLADGSTETLQGKLSVERQDTDGKFVHTIAFDIGDKGSAPRYSRSMDFEQVDGQPHQLQVTDTLSPGTKQQVSYVTIIDLDAGTQCKVKSDDSSKGLPDDTGTGSDANGGGVDSGSTDSSGGAVDAGSSDASSNDPGAGKPVDDGGAGKGKPVDNDDDDKPSTGKPVDGGTQNPGQNPGQTPSQSPGQYPAQK